MKASVQVFKTDIGQHPGLGGDLSILCNHTEDHGDVVEFFPKEGEMMNVICALLDREVVYKLNLEPKTVEKSRS
jgi:hypothetical protein